MSLYEDSYHKLRVLGHKIYHYGNKGGQKRILIALHHHHNEMSQRQLMEYLEIKAGSLSEILSKMEEEGLIIRKPNPLKKKCLRIHVTDKGKERINEYILQRNHLIESLFKDFNDEEIIEFEKILDKLIFNFENMEG